MPHKFINKFWLAVTALIGLGLFVCLFPLLLDKYGLMRAILWSLLIPVAMALAYIRGYWVSTWLSGKDKK
ncbi:MAG: hypothetical protein JSW34_10220 [Candidatus Zixiibacteriota bacterium]|nr:MAG: hypothetical protein JSW34_10220 [candidate division Zixibacteria bacterium]